MKGTAKKPIRCHSPILAGQVSGSEFKFAGKAHVKLDENFKWISADTGGHNLHLSSDRFSEIGWRDVQELPVFCHGSPGNRGSLLCEKLGYASVC